ncbi:MAG: hypothetical protein MUE33_04110 [Cytophagaceae bacterium]|jgi:hypothetical protein|nr:hypothetical protein [Cytophagaceae bacterium]
MRQLLLLCILVLGSFIQDQSLPLIFNKVLEAKLTSAWKEKEEIKKGSTYIATYLRSKGDSLRSTGVYSIQLQLRNGMDIKTYSTQQLNIEKKRPNFVVEKVITASDGVLPFPYGVGYWCTYTDSEGGGKTKAFYAHALDKNTACSILLKISQDDFYKVEGEWLAIIKSHRFK